MLRKFSVFLIIIVFAGFVRGTVFEPNLAVEIALDVDPAFGIGDDNTWKEAIKTWEEFLARKDITAEQRLFATWRLGCLWSVNFAGENGEVRDLKKSEEYFKEVMEMKPGLFSEEKIDSATIYGSLPGSDMERAGRLAEAYRFLTGATEQMYVESSERINEAGYVLDGRYLGVDRGGINAEANLRWLRGRMGRAQDVMKKYIIQFLESSQDEAAKRRLTDEFGVPGSLTIVKQETQWDRREIFWLVGGGVGLMLLALLALKTKIR